MRKPKRTKVKKSARFPEGRKYTGSIRWRGRQVWVPGAFPTEADFNLAAAKLITQLEDQDPTSAEAQRVLTVGEFAGLTYDKERGLVVPRPGVTATWPWTHPRQVTKESSFENGLANIRPFIRDHEHRPVDSFRRKEARNIADGYPDYVLNGIRRLFGDMIEDEVIEGANPFSRLGRKIQRRIERPDFEIVTREFVELLVDCALRSRPDDYGLNLKAIVLCQASTAMRPGEIFGTQHHYVNLDEQQIEVRWQFDARGRLVPVKNSLVRFAPMSPELIAAYMEAPRLSGRWAFPAPRGGHFKRSTWDRYWSPIRTLAGRPDFEFYELKHHAITMMVTPVESGGLGIDLPTAAEVAGHQDKGETIARFYLKLDQQEAARRVAEAMRRRANGSAA
jgi:integrase